MHAQTAATAHSLPVAHWYGARRGGRAARASDTAPRNVVPPVFASAPSMPLALGPCPARTFPPHATSRQLRSPSFPTRHHLVINDSLARGIGDRAESL